jgi:hypothetical protein
MSSEKEREARAFEALIVSRLRTECDPDKAKSENLPTLNAKEKAALKALGPNLIDRLWENGEEIKPTCPTPESACAEVEELAMNRAEEVDEETAKELARKKLELLERLKKRRDQKNHE